MHYSSVHASSTHYDNGSGTEAEAEAEYRNTKVGKIYYITS